MTDLYKVRDKDFEGKTLATREWVRENCVSWPQIVLLAFFLTIMLWVGK